MTAEPFDVVHTRLDELEAQVSSLVRERDAALRRVRKLEAIIARAVTANGTVADVLKRAEP